MKVSATAENAMRCICCKTCPTFKHTLCTGWAYCATGKSEKTPEMLGCDCQKCPIYAEYGLTGSYYCIHGASA